MTSRHLFIAGTGRAGTSFLVRYLSALGLDTNLTRHGEAGWHEQAQAGLEDVPIPGQVANLPYVVKSPWLYEFIDEVLTSPDLVLDAVIMPVRDLSEAATSRSVQELRAMHESTPWMARLDRTWESWGLTPGGVVYSVNPLDQARLLAVGFHKVVERLVKAEIPIVFLAFPRLATDADYLFRALKPLLPEHVSRESALAAHARVADPGKVRVGPELEAATKPRPVVAYETHETVDRVALRREVVRLRALADATAEELAASTREAVRLRALADATADELAASTREAVRLRALADATAEELAASTREADYLRSAIDIIRGSSS
ncbi:MAG TPA: hypothetical protein VGH36_14435 [Acetobacteraceae bacterium]